MNTAPKITVYKWILRGNNTGRYYISSNYHATAEEASRGHSTVVGPVEDSACEVKPTEIFTPNYETCSIERKMVYKKDLIGHFTTFEAARNKAVEYLSMDLPYYRERLEDAQLKVAQRESAIEKFKALKES